MIELFKITHNIYDAEVSPNLRYYPKSNIRSNKYKLHNHTFHYDIREHSFSADIVNIWNGTGYGTVKTVPLFCGYRTVKSQLFTVL